MKLSLDTLEMLPEDVKRPRYDIARLKCGIVHLGVGAFHRAHQAVFTDEAMAHSGGAWGIVGVSMRQPDVASALSLQDGLYTAEILDTLPRYQLVGAIRRACYLRSQLGEILDSIANPDIHILTLTITELGYCFKDGGLKLAHADIVHDIQCPHAPRSALGVLVAGLARRRNRGAGPITIISCDNLVKNGSKLRDAVNILASYSDAALGRWMALHVSFPESIVDCIVPASTRESRRRTDTALNLEDGASVQREPYAQWVIEDRFAGPRPDWGAVGVEFVASCEDSQRLKLHVLNAAHSALAYMGLWRGHRFVREAIADATLREFVEDLIKLEVTPVLTGLDVAEYWSKIVVRFKNPMIDHRLDQIAQDGAAKLLQRYSPLMLANLKEGKPYSRMAAVYAAWLEFAAGAYKMDELSDPVWRVEALRRAILGAGA